MNDLEYVFKELINIVETRRDNAYRKVNEELISLYWDFGKYVSEIVSNSKWGNNTILKIVEFMKEKYPTLRGFNRPGIYRMKQFYETYKDYLEFVSPLVRQISWTNHIQILSSTKSIEEKIFYMELTIKNNYTKRELERQIASSYYERYMLSDGKALVKVDGQEDYPNMKILDTYSLEFLDLPIGFNEKDLRKAIISNLKKFILEIGKSFTFIGEEYRIQVGKEDFYIDLLFYNRELSCMVAIELKTDKFRPEYISKMDFYLEALDRQEKKVNENPSVGIILCTYKDEEVVEYALSRSISPTMVSEYHLNLIDKKLLAKKLKEIREYLEDNNYLNVE